MKLRTLKVGQLASIEAAELTFGPGLNVFSGPNEIGKSTLAAAIRVALLLPSTSKAIEPLVPWAGGTPTVELTFETAPERIYRVKKTFNGNRGEAVLESSRDGKSFTEEMRSRGVDGCVRELLGWGIAEPGGAGKQKGIANSFLATMLLSTQGGVTDVLSASMGDDEIGSGRDRLAEALSAMAEDPQYTSLLQHVVGKVDEAFTASGQVSRKAGSPLKVASEAVATATTLREELDAKREGAKAVRDVLAAQTLRRDTALVELEEARELAAAGHEALRRRAQVDSARAAVTAAELRLAELLAVRDDAARVRASLEGLAATRDAARNAAAAATEAEREATKRANDAEHAAQSESDAAAAAEIATARAAVAAAEARHAELLREQQAAAEYSRRVQQLATAEGAVEDASRALTRAEEQVAAVAGAEAATNEALAAWRLTEAALEGASDVARARQDLEALEQRATRRGALLATQQQAEAASIAAANKLMLGPALPTKARLLELRRLDAELGAARSALEVGLTVRIEPKRPISLGVRPDGQPGMELEAGNPLNVEAKSSLDLEIGDVALLRISGGGKDARERLRVIRERWEDEVRGSLAAVGLADLDELDQALERRRDDEAAARAAATALDAATKALSAAPAVDDAAMAALRQKIASLSAAIPDSWPTGVDPTSRESWRAQRARLESDLRAAAGAVAKAAAGASAAAARVAVATSEVAAAREELARLTPIAAPSELPAAVAAAAAALVAARDTLRALEAGQQARAASVADATRIAREAAEAARAEVSRCAARVEAAAAQVASAQARAEQLDAEVARRDEAGLRATRDAAAAHFATVANSAEAGPDEAAVRALDARVAEWTAAYEDAQREVHRGQGALEHTGGTVADERLRDAVAAVEYAEQREAEVTVEYRGWQLLHQVLLDAERDQAANLGAAAAPLVVGRLRALTGTRYDSLVLDPNLHTEGVVSAGKIRAVDRLSVGTREQLATLLRLCLAERLGSAVVLDDQLVQSDLARMSRFHSFLHEVAERAQVVVFTCRRGDYLDGAAPPNVIDTDLTAKIRPFR